MLWNNSSFSYKVFSVQKKTILILEGAPERTHCKTLFKKLKILPLPYVFRIDTHVHPPLSRWLRDLCGFTQIRYDIIVPRSTIKTSSNNKTDVMIYNFIISRFPNPNLKRMNLKTSNRFIKNYLLEQCFIVRINVMITVG